MAQTKTTHEKPSEAPTRSVGVQRLVMHLEPDEAAMIEKYRAEKDAERLARELQKTTLLLVGGWMAFHEETGSGLTWSTFLNDFDADQYIPLELQKYHQQIYQMLDNTISGVYHKSCEIVGA